MDWVEIIVAISGTLMLVSFLIVIIVSYMHGGGVQMSPWDPALKNKITPTGKKVIRFAIGLFFSSIVVGFMLLELIVG